MEIGIHTCRILALTLILATGPVAADALSEIARPRALPQGLAEPDVLSAEAAFPLDTRPEETGALTVRFDVQPGYYLYRGKFSVEAVNPSPDLPSAVPVQIHGLPEGDWRDDPVFGEVEVYQRPVSFRIEHTSPQDVEVELRYQGCAEAGICYQPQKVRLLLGGRTP